MFASKREADLPARVGNRVTTYTTEDRRYTLVRFDRRQTNEPNPILVAFRKDVTRRGEHVYWGDTWDSTMEWLDHATESDPACRESGITKAHIAHARKVLTRLSQIGDKA